MSLYDAEKRPALGPGRGGFCLVTRARSDCLIDPEARPPGSPHNERPPRNVSSVASFLMDAVHLLARAIDHSTPASGNFAS